jgi:prolipoprotein diacylglyceryltransferase
VRAKDDRFLGPFTIAQLISVLLMIVGIVLWARRGDREAVVPA